jgi:hypothetical protein
MPPRNAVNLSNSGIRDRLTILVPLTYGLSTWRPRIVGSSKNVLIPGFTVVVLDNDCLVLKNKPDAHPAMLGVDQLGIVGKVAPGIFARRAGAGGSSMPVPSARGRTATAQSNWRVAVN